MHRVVRVVRGAVKSNPRVSGPRGVIRATRDDGVFLTSGSDVHFHTPRRSDSTSLRHSGRKLQDALKALVELTL